MINNTTQEPPAYLLHKLVYELDRAADKLLKQQLGISYKRALFLLALQRFGTLTQHELAVRLGYSDPAVSAMLLVLVKDKYVTVVMSPEHKRKRLVRITLKGTQLVKQGNAILGQHYKELLSDADIDAEHYYHLNGQLYQVLEAKNKELT